MGGSAAEGGGGSKGEPSKAADGGRGNCCVWHASRAVCMLAYCRMGGISLFLRKGVLERPKLSKSFVLLIHRQGDTGRWHFSLPKH